MPRPGTDGRPLRVAVIGAGPAGFYTAEHLFRQADLAVEVDLYDRLPTPTMAARSCDRSNVRCR